MTNIIKKPEDDDKEDPYTSLGYTKGSWKKKTPPPKSDKKSTNNVRKPVRESTINEEQFVMYLLDRIETEHPEIIRRYGMEEVLDSVVDIVDNILNTGSFQVRDLDTYITKIIKKLENFS